jgi:RimJ/RimL family protein N-acetyltransferase
VPKAFSGEGAGVIDVAMLMKPMADGDWVGGHIRVVPIKESHREDLRIVCDPSDHVWDIFPANWSGESFDPSFDDMLASHGRHCFTIMVDETVTGTTSLLNLKLDQRTLEIGGSYLAMAMRGTGLNARVKRLLLDHLFGCGIRRIGFYIDARNKRSQRAVAKIGGVREGVLRAERITWTGHVRDTVVFSILADEWRAKQQGVGV